MSHLTKPLSITIPPPSGSLTTSAPPTAVVPSSAASGTTEFPLIPKRRRRTTPNELAMLEEEFQRNPLPSPSERGKIADRVGMTPRGVQVWLQNRRQKEKKDANTYHPESASSSTHGGNEEDRYSFYRGSSSPIGSTTPSTPSFINSGFLSPSFNAVNPFNAVVTASSLGNKENAASSTQPSLTPKPASSPNYIYTYQHPPSRAIAAATAAANVSLAASLASAKKHTKKRPLGSHAPLARKPSLSHNFNFPDSPEKKKMHLTVPDVTVMGVGSGMDRQTLKRQISIDSLKSIGDNLFNESRKDSLSSTSSASSSSAGGVNDSLAPPPTLRTNSMPLPTTTSSSLTASALSLVSPPPKEKDEVWQHMLSDPPQTSSPVPFHSRSSYSIRPKPTRATSNPTSSNSGTANALQAANSLRETLKLDQHNRAGLAETCAQRALERKRARIVRGDVSISDGSMSNEANSNSNSKSTSSSISTSNKRTKSNEGGKEKENNKRMSVKAAARVLSAATRRHATAPIPIATTTPSPTSSTRSPYSEEEGEEPDLSFASSTTDSVMSAGVRTPPASGVEWSVGAGDGKAGDEERECAELLLGLGGFK